MASPVARRRLRAPEADRGKLIEPPRSDWALLIRENQSSLAKSRLKVLGQPIAELVAEARRALVELARRHTSQYTSVDMTCGDVAQRPILLAGHQPEMFHPGVWYKNFALAGAAATAGATAINLLIDSDLCRRTSLAVPAGDAQHPHVQRVPFDTAQSAVPFEERAVIDAHAFGSFAQRVQDCLGPLVESPLIEDYWPRVVTNWQRGCTLGAALAAARHQLESEWILQQRGAPTWEVPISDLCDTPAFARFAIDIAAALPQFAAAYNGALTSYRQAHKLRNSAQPVPDLVTPESPAGAGWSEAPFWVWAADRPARLPLFARHSSQGLVLSDRQAWEATVPDPAKHPVEAVEAFAELRTRGAKIRSRALTTTLFARLILGDLFIHGIGGGKYDEVTDAIIDRFYGEVPPRYAIVSATARLPIAVPPVRDERLREIRCELRDLTYHAEKYAAGELSPEQRAQREAAISSKRDWIETPQTSANAGQRHAGIVAANRALQPFVAPRREQLESQIAVVQRQSRAAKIFLSREYAFCLHPKQSLQDLLLDAIGTVS